MSSIRVACAQLNLRVGNIDVNADSILAAMAWAEGHDADVLLLPELAITGYPPEDLLLKPGFVVDNRRALETLAESVTGSCAAVVGFADGTANAVYNGVACIAHGEVCSTYHKRALPNYDVFDEKRVFRAGVEPMRLHEIGGARVGMSICEDAWIAGGPVPQLAAGGAEIVMNVNASPYYRRKVPVRDAEMLSGRRPG